MTTLHLRRSHALGLERARQVAAVWMDEAQTQWAMKCELKSSDSQDAISFSRSGVSGTLLVTAEAFELKANLGFLMAAFAPAIETQISQNIDRLLAQGQKS